jgi:hypothetical protein
MPFRPFPECKIGSDMDALDALGWGQVQEGLAIIMANSIVIGQISGFCHERAYFHLFPLFLVL